jgi:hypothetical protein
VDLSGKEKGKKENIQNKNQYLLPWRRLSTTVTSVTSGANTLHQHQSRSIE